MSTSDSISTDGLEPLHHFTSNAVTGVLTPERTTVLAQLADLIAARRRPKSVLRVGIDGVDGVGKSALGASWRARSGRGG